MRDLFDRLERAVGSRLEDATRTEEFAGFVTVAKRLEAGLRRAYLAATAEALHRMNIPAWSDLVELSDQVAGLDGRVRDLAMRLETPKRRSSRRPPRSSARSRS